MIITLRDGFSNEIDLEVDDALKHPYWPLEIVYHDKVFRRVKDRDLYVEPAGGYPVLSHLRPVSIRWNEDWVRIGVKPDYGKPQPVQLAAPLVAEEDEFEVT